MDRAKLTKLMSRQPNQPEHLRCNIYLCIRDSIQLMQRINFAKAVKLCLLSVVSGPRAAPEALVPADPILSLSLCTLFKTIFRPISLPPGGALTSSEGELQRTE